MSHIRRRLLLVSALLALTAMPASAVQGTPAAPTHCIVVSNHSPEQILVNIGGRSFRVPAQSVRTFNCVTYSQQP